jgi:3,4-dihydroxy-2-butanone 4-phosphate synthase
MSLACTTLARGCEPQNEVDREKVARLFGEEFHTPNHIFLCVENAIENAGGFQVRNGHTKLSVAFGKLAGIVPILVSFL